MNKFSLLALLGLFSFSVAAQTDNFFLVNSLNNKKRVKIKTRLPSTLLLNKHSPAANMRTNTVLLTGFIESMDDSVLTFRIKLERINREAMNGFASQTTNYFEMDTVEIRRVNMSGISEFRYTRPSSNVLKTIGDAITSISVITSLFVAPLTSFNYKSGEINSTQYLLLAGAGVAGIIVGIPISKLGGEKRYSMTLKSGVGSKKRWFFSR